MWFRWVWLVFAVYVVLHYVRCGVVWVVRICELACAGDLWVVVLFRVATYCAWLVRYIVLLVARCLCLAFGWVIVSLQLYMLTISFGLRVWFWWVLGTASIAGL